MTREVTAAPRSKIFKRFENYESGNGSISLIKVSSDLCERNRNVLLIRFAERDTKVWWDSKVNSNRDKMKYRVDQDWTFIIYIGIEILVRFTKLNELSGQEYKNFINRILHYLILVFREKKLDFIVNSFFELNNSLIIFHIIID